MNIYPHVSRPEGASMNKLLILLSALVALALCGYGITPAMADDHHPQRSNEHRVDQRHDVRHDRGDYRDRHDPYFYAPPVYAPPVYVAPAPSPGVSLFFPLDIRIR
jgi:hypothetical protein